MTEFVRLVCCATGGIGIVYVVSDLSEQPYVNTCDIQCVQIFTQDQWDKTCKSKDVAFIKDVRSEEKTYVFVTLRSLHKNREIQSVLRREHQYYLYGVHKDDIKKLKL